MKYQDSESHNFERISLNSLNTVSIEGYIRELNESGRRAHLLNGSIWADYVEFRTVMRLPCFEFSTPPKEELDDVFNKLNPIFLSYAIRDEMAPNSYLYISRNKNYSIDNLDKNGRRDARRATRNFEYKLSSFDEIRSNGYKCFKDTRERNGLSDGNEQNFLRVLKDSEKLGSNYVVSAINRESGATGAFCIMTAVADWIEITGVFSDNEQLSNCPNNGLFDFAQNEFLVNGNFQVLSYGYSSIQKDSSIDGLHAFKLRVGFEAVPIRRYFILNNRYHFIKSEFFKGIANILLKIFPKSRVINKFDGVLNKIKSESD